MALPEDHHCAWREEAERLRSEMTGMRGELEEVKSQLVSLQRQVFGKKSEKMPPVGLELRKEQGADAEESQRLRKERQALKNRLLEERVPLRVPKEARQCPHCGKSKLKQVGRGKESTVYEYVPGHFKRQVIVRETLSCSCGEYIVTAPLPNKMTDKGRYGPGFVAHVVVSKCGDSIPLYRLEKQYERLGITVARSTMCDLFHRAAELLCPLSDRLLEKVAAADVVLADETSIKRQDTKKKGYLWTFIDQKNIAYRFSANRSGQTPKEVLGGSKGTLLVDAFTGYNRVTTVEGRRRAGCLAHARRKFFEAKDQAPEAEIALNLIKDVYRVEHDAVQMGAVQSDAHLQMRHNRSKPAMDKLGEWIKEQQGRHPPKSLMGKAIRYALNNWTELTRFLDDVRLPPDNNRSEAALRVVALGRKNFLFVGNEDAGKNIAGLYSLVATCEAHGVNPTQYIRDVLIRVQDHPQSRIDELLPSAWRPAA